MSQFDHGTIVSFPSIASAAQRRANRRNCRKSTGPKTAAGKARAARNAITHGVFSRDAVLPGERTAEYIAFRNLLYASPGLRPQDWLEASIAEQYVLAKWRIRRMQTVEMMVHHHLATEIAEERIREMQELEELRAQAEDEFDDDEADDEEKYIERRLERRRRAFELAEKEPVPIFATVAGSIAASAHGMGGGRDGAFERIARNIYRLELSASRALRELRQLRKDKGVDVTKLSGCPFIDAIPDEADEQARHDAEMRAHTETVARLQAALGVVDDLLARARDAQDEDEDREDASDVPAPTVSGPACGAVPDEAPNALNAPAQNEANSAAPRTSEALSDDCEQRARNIELVEPTRLAPRDAGERLDDGKEERDRT